MKIYIHKLGCPKNDVDADYIAGSLIAAGHEQVQNPGQADVILVNTCCFIQPAREESVDEILRLAQLKKTGSLKRLYLTGCFAQHNGQELLDGMPEIDGAFGLGELKAISEAVSGNDTSRKWIRTESERLDFLAGNKREIDSTVPYSYLKLSDGCDRRCSFCIIPQIRGHFRSRSIDDIVREAVSLAEQGQKELILVSQDSTVYGRDLSPKSNIVELLGELNGINDIEWIRLMYLHPAQTSVSLIECLADSTNKVLPYFDLPLQHANTEILQAMKRQSDRKMIDDLVMRIRSSCDNSILRSTFIVGFPGETEEQFEELCEMIQLHRFDRLGAFEFSCEPGSSAAELPGQISDEIKNERLDRLMNLQREIAFDINDSLIGKRLNVMLDRFDDNEVAVGRSGGDCPEIDQEVFVKGNNLRVGDLCEVLIEQSLGYDLEGVKIEG